MTSPQGSSTDQVRFLLFVSAVSVAILWILPIRSSLWLDETVTYWVTKDGLASAVSRALRFRQSPGFSVIERAVVAAGGRSEWLLRLPSLIAMGAACYVLYRLAKRLFDAKAAIIGLVVFVLAPNVAFAAGDARPYAIGLLAALTSALCFVRWVDEGGLPDAIVCALTAATAIYMHYLFALMIVAQFAYVITTRKAARPRWRDVVLLAVGMVALLIPLSWTLVSLWRDRKSLSVPAPGSWGTLVRAIAPPVLVAAIFLGLAATSLFERLQLQDRTSAPRATHLAFSLFLFPSLALFVFSRTSGTTLFADRYFILTTPGLALVVGSLLARVGSERAIRVALLFVFAFSVISYVTPNHTPERWREAAVAVTHEVGTSNVPVLVHAGLIESGQISWLQDRTKASYLTAPLTYYRMPGRIITLPYATAPGSTQYLEGVVERDLLGTQRFVLVSAYQSAFLKTWLDGRLLPEGFRSGVLLGNGLVQVFVYQR